MAQLIDASTEANLWAETYDRDYADVFAIQSDVAQQIASALQAMLTTEEKSLIETRPTENMAAYDYYLKGNYYWNNYATWEGNEQAIRMYENAVQLDPGFAQAWAWLSIVSGTLVSIAAADFFFSRNIVWSGGAYDIQLQNKYLQKAKATLDMAMTINPDLAETHTARGKYLMKTGDYTQAQKEFEAALHKQPNNSQIVQRMGLNFLHQRKMARAADYFKREYELNPQGLQSGAWVAYTYEFSRNWPEAEKWTNLFIAKRPEDGAGYYHKVNIYSWGYGKVKEALAAWEEGMSLVKEYRQLLGSFKYDLLLSTRNYAQALRSLEADSSNRFNAISRGEVYRLMGDADRAFTHYDSARFIFEKLTREVPEIPFYHSALGLAYAGLGRKDEAIREGKKAVALQPIKSDMYWYGERLQLNLAHIYIMVGEYDQTMDHLETLLSIPSQLTIWRLKLDPRYDPLRNMPGFQELLDQYSEGGS